MTEPAQTPSEGALSLDDAVGILAATDAPEPTVEPTNEAEPEAETVDEPEEASGDGDEQADEPDVPAVKPPAFWDAEDKEAFASLDPEAQAVMARAADKQNAASSKAIEAAATKAKEFQGQAESVNQLAAALSVFLPKAVETFKGRWDGIDWPKFARESPDQYVATRAQFDAESQDLQRLDAARQESVRQARSSYTQGEATKLAELLPEIVDKKTGPALKVKLVSHLQANGVSPEQIEGISAQSARMAYESMLWREGKANLSAPKDTPAAGKMQPKPSAKPPGNSQQREADRLSRRLSQTRSVDDAVAYMLAKGL